MLYGLSLKSYYLQVEEWATNNNASAPAPSDVASVATLSIAAEEPNYASLVVDAASDSMPDMGAEVQAEETTKWCQQLKEQVEKVFFFHFHKIFRSV